MMDGPVSTTIAPAIASVLALIECYRRHRNNMKRTESVNAHCSHLHSKTANVRYSSSARSQLPFGPPHARWRNSARSNSTPVVPREPFELHQEASTMVICTEEDMLPGQQLPLRQEHQEASTMVICTEEDMLPGQQLPLRQEHQEAAAMVICTEEDMLPGATHHQRFSRPAQKHLTQCRFYLSMKCKLGDECPFAHNGTPVRSSTPCWYFRRHGMCIKGDRCPYSHVSSSVSMMVLCNHEDMLPGYTRARRNVSLQSTRKLSPRWDSGSANPSPTPSFSKRSPTPPSARASPYTRLPPRRQLR